MEADISLTTIAVLGIDDILMEFTGKGIPQDCRVIHLQDQRELSDHPSCLAIFDLSFEPNKEKLVFYRSLSPTPVLINCMELTNQQLAQLAGSGEEGTEWNILRINAWPTFLAGNSIEVAGDPIAAKNLFEKLDWKFEPTPDIAGFITARVVSMIINEAFFALQEGVSTKEEIDIAMKLGTNYPYGPFEWADKIGLKKIRSLLMTLAETDPRYQPCELLIKEALT